MGGRELDLKSLGAVSVDPVKLRALAVHCADRVATAHPTEFDDSDPEFAGRLIAHDPTVRDQVLELLDAIGYSKETP